MKRIIFTAFFIMIFTQISFADDKIVVETLLKERISKITATLQNKSLDDQGKKKMVEECISPIVNFHLMSMLVLGRDPWTSLSEADQNRFIKLFTKTIEETLLSKILNYADEDIIIEKADQSGNKINIMTCIVSKEKKLAVLYKFYHSGAQWKIYDVEIEGVSILKNFKAQFEDSLREMTAQELILKMEKPVTSR